MEFPDLVVDLHGSSIIALLPLNGRYLSKSLPRNYGGMYDLIAWMDDLGMRECCVRIRSGERETFDTAINIAVLLGMAGHTVSMTKAHCPLQGRRDAEAM